MTTPSSSLHLWVPPLEVVSARVIYLSGTYMMSETLPLSPLGEEYYWHLVDREARDAKHHTVPRTASPPYP